MAANLKIRVERTENVQFVSTNAAGAKIVMDGPADMGGKDAGLRPMETLLSALAGCSAIDVIHIMGKQRQDLQSLAVEVGLIPGARPSCRFHGFRRWTRGGPGAVFTGLPRPVFTGLPSPVPAARGTNAVPLDSGAGGLELERPHRLAGVVGAMDAEAYGLKASGSRSTSS
jgi:hypothetical protein